MSTAKTICLIGSQATKSEQFNILMTLATQAGLHVVVEPIKVSPTQLRRQGRKAAFIAASKQLSQRLRNSTADGFLAIGGGAGSWIAIEAMQQAGIGAVPKVLVSTQAYDARIHAAGLGLVIVPAANDLIGINPVLQDTLVRALAILKALLAVAPPPHRKIIAVTAMGMTQQCAAKVVKILEQNALPVHAFHAVGFGSAELVRWLEEDRVAVLADLTAHDTHALLRSRVAAYKDRLALAAERGIPTILAPGGLDFISSTAATLSPLLARRPSYEHGPIFVHLRSTKQEMRAVAKHIGKLMKKDGSKMQVLVPTGGLSEENRPGGVLWAPETDAVFLRTLQSYANLPENLQQVATHINTSAFARVFATAVTKAYKSVMLDS